MITDESLLVTVIIRERDCIIIKTDIILYISVTSIVPSYYHPRHHVHPVGELSFHFKKGTPYGTQTHRIYPLPTYPESLFGNCERNCTPIS